MDYKTAGVDIDAGNKAVQMIKGLVQKTYSPNVLSKLGLFSACFEIPTGYKEPVLVSCTDGVGTKLRIAIELDIFDTIGIDLVAMNVNDLICCGAKPLFFLDYIACNKLIPEKIKEIIKGMTEGCLQSGCSLIGGEMAEMNDMYKQGDYDLAGFSVGIVEKSKIIDGAKITPNQNVYGIPSSGIHSNGYSLARKIMTAEVMKKYDVNPKEMLIPTRIYVKQILNLLEEYTLTGISHITGGGLKENIARLLPENTNVLINKNKVPKVRIFEVMQEAGHVTEEEMLRVFNMGIGMVFITPQKIEENADLILLGKTVEGTGEVFFE